MSAWALGAGAWAAKCSLLGLRCPHTHRWPFNANFHGGATGRRRLYTLGFAPEVVAAATRAGIEVGPQPEPMPLSERITLGDVLFDEDVIRAHHPGTSTSFRVQPRQLSGDRTEEAKAARVDTGLYEPEPVRSDHRNGDATDGDPM